LYADDTTIQLSDSDIDRLYDTARFIFNAHSTWFAANRLALNDSKTNFVVFTTPRAQVALRGNLQFDNHNVSRVDFVLYLGFIIYLKLSWDNHLLHVSNKVNKGLGLLKRGCNVS
jgi:hypothetical protein